MIKYQRLNQADISSIHGVLDCFADAFEDDANYRANRPDEKYLLDRLSDDSFICLSATYQGAVVGALAAYELKKFEQNRSEIYIYDLAVSEDYRRQGIATGLIEYLKPIARARGAWVIYVQADLGDRPAVELYSKLGVKEDVHHFDIPVIDR